MENVCYAVGYMIGRDDVNRESLKFFEKEENAFEYYFQELHKYGFDIARVLAIFRVENNRIKMVSRLDFIQYDTDIGPVGPKSGTEIIK